jgi:hypothetical protein
MFLDKHWTRSLLFYTHRCNMCSPEYYNNSELSISIIIPTMLVTKHWLLGGWYPRWNTDYWEDDAHGETLTTGRMIHTVKHWLLGGWYPRWNTDYWEDDTHGETLTTGRVIPTVKHWLLGGWYPRWNTDYWEGDTHGETLTTGRMIPTVKHWLLGGWYTRRLILTVQQQRYRPSDSNKNVCI